MKLKFVYTLYSPGEEVKAECELQANEVFNIKLNQVRQIVKEEMKDVAHSWESARIVPPPGEAPAPTHHPLEGDASRREG